VNAALNTMPMGQSRRMSLVESLTNIAVGRKSCQALFSRGIDTAKSLMVRSHRGNRKSRFSKMVFLIGETR
jgi:hypothetical protein